MQNIVHKSVVFAYLIMEILVYIIFLSLDLMQLPSTQLKYLSICLCFAMGVYLFVVQRSWLIFLAMAFTLTADTFLLLLDDYYLVGVAAFCVVQTLYGGCLIFHSDWKWIILRGILFIPALAILYHLDSLEWLTVASAWSYTQLIANVIHAYVIRRNYERAKMFLLGLLLFLGCDTCVGIYNLTAYLPGLISADVMELSAFCMWLFYLPAQVLIIMSFWKKNECV